MSQLSHSALPQVGLVVSSFCVVVVAVAKLLTIAIQSDVATRLSSAYHVEWC